MRMRDFHGSLRWHISIVFFFFFFLMFQLTLNFVIKSIDQGSWMGWLSSHYAGNSGRSCFKLKHFLSFHLFLSIYIYWYSSIFPFQRPITFTKFLHWKCLSILFAILNQFLENFHRVFHLDWFERFDTTEKNGYTDFMGSPRSGPKISKFPN